MNAVIRRYYGREPELMSYEETAKLFNEWLYTEELKEYKLVQTIRKAMSDE